MVNSWFKNKFYEARFDFICRVHGHCPMVTLQQPLCLLFKKLATRLGTNTAFLEDCRFATVIFFPKILVVGYKRDPFNGVKTRKFLEVNI